MSSPAIAGPVEPDQRIDLVDALRGFALLGILIANWAHRSDTSDKVLTFLVDGSFYTMYSFLFGLGFALQLIRAEETHRPFVLRYLWRTLILFCIGLAHFVLVWRGDILRIYALLAPVLLLVRRWNPRYLVALAAIFLVLSVAPAPAPDSYIWTRIDPEHVDAERVAEQLRTGAELSARAGRPEWCASLWDPWNAGVCDRIAENRILLTRDITTIEWWMAPDDRPGLLCMFVLGLYVGRRRILRNAGRHTRLLATTAGIALIVGVAGNALDVFGDDFAAKGIALPSALDGWRIALGVGNVALSLFYVAVFALVFTRWQSVRRALAPLANAGRMGLTNYLVQSIIFMRVLGYRDGVWARMTGWRGALLIIAVIAAQMVFSTSWFRHFRTGPAEWVWRSLTWLRAQPMRVRMVAQRIGATD